MASLHRKNLYGVPITYNRFSPCMGNHLSLCKKEPVKVIWLCQDIDHFVWSVKWKYLVLVGCIGCGIGGDAGVGGGVG